MQLQPILDNFRVSPCMIHIFISVTSSMRLMPEYHIDSKKVTVGGDYISGQGGWSDPDAANDWRSILACF